MNYSYKIDDKILNYTGTIPQNLYVRKMVDRNDTTYTVSPIEAKSKLGRWLQEHSPFFNSIITWFLSKSLQKDPNCLVLKENRVNQEPQHQHILDKIVYRITNNTSPFFHDNDVENVVKSISTGIINNPQLSDGKKIEYFSRILENHHNGTYTLDDADIKEAVKHAIDLINGGPYTQTQIDQIVIPLAELIEENCDEETSKNLTNFLIDSRFWNKKGIFKVDAEKRQYDLSLPLDLLKKSPERILELFSNECFSKYQGANKLNIIALNDSFKTEKGKNQADDKGGPSRQFMSTLFESLVKNSEKLRFKKLKESGLYLPKSPTTNLDKQEEMLYEAIGKLMGMCLTSKGYLLIGQIFDASVYEMMAKIYPLAINGRFENLSDDTYFEIYKITMGKDDFVEKYRSVKNYYASDEEVRAAYNLANSMFPDWPETLDPNSKNSLRQHQHVILNELKQIMVERAQANESVLPIFKICQGMAKHYRGLANAYKYDNPANMDGNVMVETIQGKFSKELVKQSLMFIKDENNQIVDVTMQGYFHQWIDESDEEQVRKFLIVTTGSNSIGFEAGIDIVVNNYNNQEDATVWPKSNTCTKQMTIQNYPNYELFKKKLDETILNAELTDMGFDKE